MSQVSSSLSLKALKAAQWPEAQRKCSCTQLWFVVRGCRKHNNFLQRRQYVVQFSLLTSPQSVLSEFSKPHFTATQQLTTVDYKLISQCKYVSTNICFPLMFLLLPSKKPQLTIYRHFRLVSIHQTRHLIFIGICGNRQGTIIKKPFFNLIIWLQHLEEKTRRHKQQQKVHKDK